MIANEKAPTCWRTNGAKKQNVGKHPVPIVSHYPASRKRVRRRRYKLVWTPLNAALFVLLIAAMTFMLVRTIATDPLSQRDLITMANSVFRV